MESVLFLCCPFFKKCFVAIFYCQILSFSVHFVVVFSVAQTS